jgi:hypothetical protein
MLNSTAQELNTGKEKAKQRKGRGRYGLMGLNAIYIIDITESNERS